MYISRHLLLVGVSHSLYSRLSISLYSRLLMTIGTTCALISALFVLVAGPAGHHNTFPWLCHEEFPVDGWDQVWVHVPDRTRYQLLIHFPGMDMYVGKRTET
jgi:hypothetical protein